MEFYTSVDSRGDKVFVCGYRDGKKFKKVVDYKPYLFSPTEAKTPYKTIWNEPVQRVDFDSISQARGYVKSKEKLANTTCYGFTDYKFNYLYDTYPGDIDFDYSQLNVISIDIENDSKGGFADIDTADKEITAITLAKRGRSITFGMKDYEIKSPEEIYIKCKDEIELLWAFLKIWRTKTWLPDIITGWNNKWYDIRYIVNRMKRILPDGTYHKLSPFNFVSEQQINQKDGREFTSYSIFGMSILDYYEIYKKFSAGERENYKLDFILQYELGESKTDYSMYGSLAKLYEKNPQLFFEYNIQDTTSILRLEDKIHYLEQVVTMAYICKVNYDNMVKTVKPWDVLVHNHLLDRGIVVPMYEESEEEAQIIGGYCKQPYPGSYKDVGVVDFTSLYPSTAMTFNISPDTIKGMTKKVFDLDLLVSPRMEAYTKALVGKNYSMAMNGAFFKRDTRGFFPELFKYFFEERKKFRKLERVAEEEYLADEKNISKRNTFLKYKNIQTAFKLLANSGYGALANKWFRWFDNRLAEGITSTGQMTAKFVAYHLNIFLNTQYNTVDEDYIIYQDTDSAYINLKPYLDTTGLEGRARMEELVRYMKEVVQSEIDRVCQEFCNKLNAFENNLSMKFEAACDKTFFIAKKRYVLQIVWKEGIWLPKPKMKVTGLEPVRSSVPKVTREAMKVVMQLIFDEKREEIHRYIAEFKEKFFQMSFDEIGAPTGVKNLDKYRDPETLFRKGTPIHVRGSIIYNELLKRKGLDIDHELIYNHDKVKYCYLVPANPTRQNVICVKADYPKELELEQYIDYEHQWTKTFMKPIESIFTVVKFSSQYEVDLESLFA